MRYRVGAAALLGLTGLAALGASLVAVESGAPRVEGTIGGRVLGEDPVAGWHKLTDVTVEARSHGRLVAKTRASRGVFDLRLSPGSYLLRVYGPPGPGAFLPHRDCWIADPPLDTVVVQPARESRVTLRCPLSPNSSLG